MNDDLRRLGRLANLVRTALTQFASEKFDLKDKVSYWKFKELPNESFIKEFPNIVKQQEEVCKILEQEVSAVVDSGGKHRSNRSAVTNSGVTANSALVRSTNPDPPVTSLGELPPREMAMSSETRHALPVALKKLFQTHKVCRYGFSF